MPNGTRTLRYKAQSCCCADRGCPMHLGINACDSNETELTTLYRVDMADATGVPFCDGCAEDAFASGLFREGR